MLLQCPSTTSFHSPISRAGTLCMLFWRNYKVVLGWPRCMVVMLMYAVPCMLAVIDNERDMDRARNDLLSRAMALLDGSCLNDKLEALIDEMTDGKVLAFTSLPDDRFFVCIMGLLKLDRMSICIARALRVPCGLILSITFLL